MVVGLSRLYDIHNCRIVNVYPYVDRTSATYITKQGSLRTFHIEKLTLPIVNTMQGPLLLTWFNFNPSMDK